MIKGDIIYFGYGDIVIYSIAQMLHIVPIKPHQRVGTTVDMDKVEKTDETYGFMFHTLKEIDDFEESLNMVSKSEIERFWFKGTEFNFSQYNHESIRVLKINLDKIRRNFTLLMAC